MCRCLQVSPSGYDDWVTRPPSARAQENTRLLARIQQVHAKHDGVVGSPRIWEDLRYAGEQCGRHRVARLMRRAGLQGVPQRRRWRQKASGIPPAGTRNHLERNFTATAPNRKWLGDISYIDTLEGTLYLASLEDVFSRKIVGWAMAERRGSEPLTDEPDLLTAKPLELASGRTLRRRRDRPLPDRGRETGSRPADRS